MISLPFSSDERKKQLLFVSAQCGLKGVLKKLLATRVPVNQLDLKKRTPLFYACDDKIAHLLITNGADVHHKDNQGVCPIFPAILNNREKTLSILLKNGADPNTRLPDGKTPLFAATKIDNPGVFSLLLENGARLDSLDANRTSIVDYAKNQGSQSILSFLKSEMNPLTELKTHTPLDRKEYPRSTYSQPPIFEILQNKKNYCLHIARDDFKSTLFNQIAKSFRIHDIKRDHEEILKALKKLENIQDPFIQKLLSTFARISADKNIQIFVGKSLEGESIGYLYHAQKKAPALTGGYNKKMGYLYLSNPFGWNLKNRHSFFIKNFLHEITHCVVHHTGYKITSDISSALNKILHSYSPQVNHDLEAKKANDFILNRVIQRIQYARSYKNQKEKAEELICDSFVLRYYGLRHPKRKPIIEDQFSDLFSLVDQSLLRKTCNPFNKKIERKNLNPHSPSL